MLSIRFGVAREWWVPGAVFDRLFQSALDRGEMPHSLKHWHDVAEANGGFDVIRMKPEEADPFTTALREAAAREIVSAPFRSPVLDMDTYRASLKKLLNLLAAE